MRKLTVVLCVILAMLMLVPAFAAPSPSKTTVLSATGEGIPEGMWIEVVEAAPDTYEQSAVADVVKGVNAGDIATVQEAVDALADFQTGDLDVANAEFVTGFADMVLTDGTITMFNVDGAEVSPTVEMAVDALKGVEDASGYAFLMLNTSTGEAHVVNIDKLEDGVVTATFPCLGAFSLIKK